MSADEDKDSLRQNKGITATYDYRGVPTGEFEFDDDRAEKPWQRVPSSLLVIVLGVYLLIGYLTQLIEDEMPTVVKEADLAKDNSATFSEEVARRYLLRIVGEEPRVAGTEYHLNMTKDLKAMLDEIALNANQRVRTDWQIASGIYLHNSSASFYNMYQNVSNVIALLEGESGFHSNGSIGSSILVNCHYDSVPFALGASDNAAFCAIMAEVLTKLSRRREKLKRNIIFLFNGAEENGLQASHGFLQHPWAEGVSAVINLDAAGMNGKPTVFQVTDPRVLKAYSKAAPVPNAQGLAELLFGSGLIPSDTDFRIWRDFGHIYGIDMAFVKWAHVYHTRNDRPELIQEGVLQGAGDMLLATLTTLTGVPDLDVKRSPEAAVYYDYLNQFLISYSFRMSYVVDACIALLGLISVYYYVWLVGHRWSSVRKLLIVGLGRVICMLMGIITVLIFAPLMVATTVQMRYLSEPWLVVPLYWMPYLVAATATSHVFDAWFYKKNGLTRSLRTLQAQAATRLHLSVILLILVCIPPLTPLRYLFSAPLFIMAGTSLLSLTVVRIVTLQGWQQLLLEMILSLPSTMFMFSLCLRVNAQMLPIMGRSSSDTPDYTVAMLNVALAVITAATVSGMELLFSRKRLWLALGVVGGISVVFMFIPFNPYESNGISLQRHYWFHSEIASHDINGDIKSKTTGIVVTKNDPYTTQSVVPELTRAGYNVNTRTNFTKDCEEQVYCGLPLFRTGFGRHLPRAMFIYTGGPAPFVPPVSVIYNRSCTIDTCSFSFLFTGANHNLLTLWPRNNVTLTSWSLSSPPAVCHVHRNRPVYVIYHSTPTYGDVPVVIQLSVEFKVDQSLQSSLQSNQPILDVSHHTHKIYSPELFTDEYNKILEAMPDHFNIATFLSFRHDYEF